MNAHIGWGIMYICKYNVITEMNKHCCEFNADDIDWFWFMTILWEFCYGDPKDIT